MEVAFLQYSLQWRAHNMKNCVTCMLRKAKAKGGRSKKGKRPGRPKNIVTVEDMMSLDGSKPIPVVVMKAASHIVNIEVKNSILPNTSIQLSSGGPQPFTLTPILVARKESQMVSKRTLSLRTKQTTTVMKMIAGNSIEATTTQTAHMVKSMDMVEREEVLKK